MNKKNNLEGNKAVTGLIIGALTLAFVMFPFFLNYLLVIPGRGSDDGWLGFWGSYLGSGITIVFAYHSSIWQSEKAIKDNRKAEYLIYRDKLKIDKIFEVQTGLAQIDIDCRIFFEAETVLEVIDKGWNKEIISKIEKLDSAIKSTSSSIEELQFYVRAGSLEALFTKIIKLLNEKGSCDLNRFMEEDSDNKKLDDLKKVLNSYRTDYIDVQIDNFIIMMDSINDSI